MPDTCIPTVQELILAPSWTISVSSDGFWSALKPLDNDCLPGWTQTGENGKNKWVKQYTMIIIACCLQKFRKENWGYGQWNNHFWLNTNFCRLFFIIFQGSSQFSGYFRDLFRGMNHFRGFSGFSGVADHPVLAANMAYRSCLTSCQTT